MISRRQFNTTVAIAGASLMLGTDVYAQSKFPAKPIKMIWPFAAGGAGSTVARLLGDNAGKILGQPVVIEERSGANGAIGVQAVIQSEPDGYTILQMSGANAILPLLQKGVYNLLGDLKPLVFVGTVPYAFAVNAKSDIKTFDDLVAQSKSGKGVSYGSGGLGSMAHLGPAKLAGDLKFKATHVPYRGLSLAVQAVLSNEVDFVCPTVLDVTQLAQSGQLRILAIAGNTRQKELPDIPTMAELGYPDFDISTYYAYLAPAKTPAPVVQALTEAFSTVAKDPATQKGLAELGIVVDVKGPEETAKYIQAQIDRWGKVIVANNIKLD